MPAGMRKIALHGSVACLLFLLVITIAAYSGFLLTHHHKRIALAFDNALLAPEPLQIGDMRASLQSALSSVERGDWSVALRLIRDGRNQWEHFLPSMREAYKAYCWQDEDLRRSANLWGDMVKHAESRNSRRLRQAIRAMTGIMDQYRQPHNT